MKIVKVSSGLGNQMFQYAFYLALKQYFTDVKIDIFYYVSYKIHNGFELKKIFDIEMDIASIYDRLKISNQGTEIPVKIIRKIFGQRKTEFKEPYAIGFFENVFSLNNDTYYDGYWQSYKYFLNIENLIRTNFKFSNIQSEQNLRYLEKISSSNSISIHIRLGDYVNHPLFSDICTKDYYNRAINYIKKTVINPVFYIFSNDINQCINEIDIPSNSYFIDWNTGSNSYLDMYLMSHCKHNIIANSSFSWWAAWLNSNMNKIVIAPTRWLNDDRIDINDIVLPDWVKL
jgi:hypothetical protein